VTNFDEVVTSGIITETEAYAGVSDKASHAFGSRRTPRTEVMYMKGGVAYVYLCYGVHHLLNVITNQEDVPHGVLIRAVEPLEGIEHMLKRRNRKEVQPMLTAGPGAMSQALGIKTSFTGCSLQGPSIRIEDRKITVDPEDIVTATRVGVGYAKEDAYLPYRFFLRNNPYVSKAKGL